jgi:DNA-directed RNA polymerase specialized sigma24 family protein
MMELHDNRQQAVTSHGVRSSSQLAANDEYFRAAIGAASYRAMSVGRTANLSYAEREDLEQEILLDLIERRKGFDPARGKATTYTATLARHRAAEYLEKRNIDGAHLVLDAALGVSIDAANDSPFDAAAQIAEGQLNATMLVCGQTYEYADDAVVLHDLQVAMDYMNGDQLSLFRLLAKHHDVADAASASEVPTATFYRRFHDLKMHLRMFGLRAVA